MFVRITGVKRQVIISSCLYIGQILNGYSGAWAGPGLPLLRDLKQSPLPYLLSESQLSLVASLTYLGAVPGTYFIAWLSNARGRKPCLILGGFVSILSYVILATATNLAMLLVSRLLTGIAVGTVNVMNLVYIGEIASPKIRGILLTAIGIFTSVGILLIFSIGPYLTYHDIIYVGITITIGYIFSLVWIPESPVFYAIQGRDEDVREVLQDLGRADDVDEILKSQKESTKAKDRNSIKDWIELFSLKSNRKALFIVSIINILQHSSGVMAIIYFSAMIFELAGSTLQPSLAMSIVMCFKLIGGFITPLFIESAGRRIILLISTAICSLSMFALGLYFYLDRIESPVVDKIKWLPLVVLIIFYIGYDSGFGIIPNALTGEMFTPNVRSKGSTMALTTAYLCGFGVTTAFGALLEIVGGHVAFWFFSVICACAFLFTVFFIPETKGKTLLDIQAAL